MRLTTGATKADVVLFPRLQLIAANLELQGLLQDLLEVALDGDVEAEVEMPTEEAKAKTTEVAPEAKAPEKSEAGSPVATTEQTDTPTEVPAEAAKGASQRSSVKIAAQMEAVSSAEATDALANVIVKLANLSKQIVRVVDGASEITSALNLEDDEEFADRMLKILISGLQSHISTPTVKSFMDSESLDKVPADLYPVIDGVLKQYFDDETHKKEITGATRQVLQNGSARSAAAEVFNRRWFLVKLQAGLREATNWVKPEPAPTDNPEKPPEPAGGGLK